MVIEMKRYNNLYDSILVTILFLGSISFGVVSEYFGVIATERNVNKPFSSVVIISLSSIMALSSFFLIFKYCYEKWWIEDDAICSKKFLQKRVKIRFDEIESISEETVSALKLETYESDAIIVKGKKDAKIVILKTKYVQKNNVYEMLKSKIKK